MRIPMKSTTALKAALILLTGWAGFANAASPASSEESVNAYLASPNVPERYKKAIKKKLDERSDKKVKREKLRGSRQGNNGAAPRGGVRRRLYKIAGGIVRGAGGVELIIPPGALPSDMRVSVRRPAQAQEAARTAKMSAAGLRDVSRAVALGPEESALLIPATITLPYDASKLNGAKDADLKIYSWNQSLGAWEPQASKVDAAKKTVRAQVSRLTTVQVLSGGAGNR